MHPPGESEELAPQGQAGGGGAPHQEQVHPLVVLDAGGPELVAQLDRRFGVGHRAGQAGEGLAGGGVRRAPFGAQAGQGLVQHRLAVPAPGLHDLHPQHAVEEEVAGDLLVRRAGLDDGHVDPQPGAGGGVQAGVVALPDVDQHEGVAPLGLHVRHAELQGPHLVAPEGEPGQVVPLDQHPGPAQRRGQLGAGFQGGGDEGEGDARQAGHAGADLIRGEGLGRIRGTDGHRGTSSLPAHAARGRVRLAVRAGA